MGAYLGREAILAAADLVTEDVHVPEWATADMPDPMVRVRGLTGKQRDEFEAGMLKQRGRQMVPDMANLRAKIVALCVVDADGQTVFTPADAAALGGKSAKAIDRVYEVAARLSGLKDEDVEELTGNFGGPNGASSASTSPASSAAP